MNEKKLNGLISALIDYYSLEDYGIIWNEGERVIPEIWMFAPNRRFTYYAHLSLYDFAVQFVLGKRILDFGCGAGYGSYYLASRGAYFVQAIDIDEISYRYACDRYKRDNLKFELKTIADLSSNKDLHGYFDFIYCSNVMEHIPDYKEALNATKILLAPNGKYLQVTPPSGKSRGNPYHVTNFTVPEWKEILLPYYQKQRYFAHIPSREKIDTNNEFEFRFEECETNEMRKKQSISGVILCET